VSARCGLFRGLHSLNLLRGLEESNSHQHDSTEKRRRVSVLLVRVVDLKTREGILEAAAVISLRPFVFWERSEVEMDEGRYFMSESERDAQLGKAVRDHENIKSELQRRTVQAAELADRFELLAKHLRESPRDIFFVSDSIPGSEFSRHKHVFDVSEIDGNVVQQIAQMIRTLQDREKEARKRLQQLGHSPG
jgi:hypothetical protein